MLQDYYPFGMAMPGRTSNSPDYRYGFNGKEKDESGEFGNLTNYDYGFRIYNPGIGRFLSVDPLKKEYPWYTPYQFAGNKPVWAIDLDGLEEVLTNDGISTDAGEPDDSPTLIVESDAGGAKLLEDIQNSLIKMAEEVLAPMTWVDRDNAAGMATGKAKEKLILEANEALGKTIINYSGGFLFKRLIPVALPPLKAAAAGVLRVGKYGDNVIEAPITKLNPLHNVPRKGAPPGNIEKIRDNIKLNGYDVTSPASATRLPNGDLIVTGGHHRIAAMKELGEETIPTKIYSYKDTDPEKLGYFLGIARTTGKYSGYLPKLTNAQKAIVNERLSAWRAHNSEQVITKFKFD